MMSSITSSYKNYNPTVTYMRGKGSNGIRRIGNKVVFLNGHGNYDNMTFSQSSKGSDYMTGVYYGKDLDSSNELKYVETDYVESDILDGAIVPISKEVVIN